MQIILDSSFARPGSAPIWGGKKVEFRDWTKSLQDRQIRSFFYKNVVFPAQTEYSHFSANFRLKIFLYDS